MSLSWNNLLSDKRIRDLYKTSIGKNTTEHRTEFERDYDRAIFCSPFRRLHDKAQVFPLEPNDTVRTRLAHSLEVSTIARDMSKTIAKWLFKEKKEIDEEQAEAIQTIAATCGLLHDLGNPPFGHAGEDAIREWFRKQGSSFFKRLRKDKKKGSKCQYARDFLNFEGNAHTIRLLSRLQWLTDEYGLNLTCGTMSALCKYIAPSDKINKKFHERKKVGYFASENDLIQKIRKETGTGTVKNPITFIVEACDDIAYSIADIEDAIKKGVVSRDSVTESLKDLGKDKIYRRVRGGIKSILEKDDNFKGPKGCKGRDYDYAWAEAFRVHAINQSVLAVIEAFKEKYKNIMDGKYPGELFEDSAANSFIKTCKKIGTSRIYQSKGNVKLELMGRKVIQDMMTLFWEGITGYNPENKASFPNKIYSLLSENYRKAYEKSVAQGLPRKYCQMQFVTDYICGMTDTFACSLHKELMNG